jgi:hypothetical protein
MVQFSSKLQILAMENPLKMLNFYLSHQNVDSDGEMLSNNYFLRFLSKIYYLHIFPLSIC